MNQFCEKSRSFLVKLFSAKNSMPNALAFLPEGHHVQIQ